MGDSGVLSGEPLDAAALAAIGDAYDIGTITGHWAGPGDGSRSLTLTLPFGGMHVALLPPGAFFGIALLLALRNRLRRASYTDGKAASGEAPR